MATSACVCLFSCEQTAEEEVEMKSDGPISLEDIGQRGVLGELGVPLGKIVMVEAVVVDGNSLRMKLYVDDYLLKIVSVDDVRMEDGPLMDFGKTPGCFLPELPYRHRGLREYQQMLANDGKYELTDAMMSEAHDAYVGSTVRLHVYESGGFRGIPSDGFPEGARHWTDTGYGFSTHLNVLCSADTKRDKEE